MEMKQYRDLVQRLASERTGEAVYNGSAAHAAVIVENIFASAQSCVRLLTGDLNAKVYGDSRVVERAKQFLGHSDHRLIILMEEVSLSSSHPLIEAIGNDENVEFYKVPEALSSVIPYHLMTGDDDCFRFEREKTSNAAVAAFGDVDTTKHLNGVFETIKDSSTRLDTKDLVS